MVNCNPETVSTDYDTSDRLYFEPLTLEDVLEVVAERERPVRGHRAVRRADAAQARPGAGRGRGPGARDLADAIDLAEDRRFDAVLAAAGLKRRGTAPRRGADAIAVAEEIGYPVLVRPSYVLGGRAMMIAYDARRSRRTSREAAQASPEQPVLVDEFLEDAIEVDVDALSDGSALSSAA